MCLTWHHAVEGDGALADEVLADGVMIPDEEAHQGQLGHVHREHQSLLPHGVEACDSEPGVQPRQEVTASNRGADTKSREGDVRGMERAQRERDRGPASPSLFLHLSLSLSISLSLPLGRSPGPSEPESERAQHSSIIQGTGAD